MGNVKRIRIMSSNVKRLEGVEVELYSGADRIEIGETVLRIDFMLEIGNLVKFGNSNIVCLGEVVGEV